MLGSGTLLKHELTFFKHKIYFHIYMIYFKGKFSALLLKNGMQCAYCTLCAVPFASAVRATQVWQVPGGAFA